MGFRGEALASIRHVARLQVVSRTADDDVASQIDAYGAEVSGVSRVAKSTGTTVVVRELFRNIPVRQRFLKTPGTEFSYCYDLVVGLSLQYPNIEFILTHDHKELINTRGISKLSDRVVVLWGQELHGKLVPVNFEFSGYSVTGVISDPTVTFSNRGRQTITVNGRLVKSPTIQKAISQAAADAIPNGRFVACVLNIEVPDGQVDVNIHPQKLDVRFTNSGFIFDILVKAIRSAWSGQRGQDRLASVSVGNQMPWQTPRPEVLTAHTNVLFQAIEWGGRQEPQAVTPDRSISFIQMFDTYLIVDAGAALLVMDQHAVHERILYEKIKAHSDAVVYQQPLLASEVISLAPDYYARFADLEPTLRTMGFDVDDFGNNQIVIRQVPVSLAGPSPERLVVTILDSFFENPDMNWDKMLQDKDRLQRMACRAAIKAGKRMTHQEVTAMILDLIDTPGNYTCPHGRPLFVAWEKPDFESMFLRT
ncbi:hypothetical protein EBR57_02450 [bacterium]|nr:hypothetical protein [bacterium]